MATARERPSPDSLLRHLSKGKTWREQLDRPVPVSCSPRALAKRLFCLQFSQAESPPGGTVGGGGGGHSSAAELSAFYRWEKKERTLHGVIFGCLIYFWLWRHVGHCLEEGKGRREREEGGWRGATHTQSLELLVGEGSGKEAQHSREE